MNIMAMFHIKWVHKAHFFKYIQACLLKRGSLQKGVLEATRDRNATTLHRTFKTPVFFRTTTIATHASQCYLSHSYYGILGSVWNRKLVSGDYTRVCFHHMTCKNFLYLFRPVFSPLNWGSYYISDFQRDRLSHMVVAVENLDEEETVLPWSIF